MREWITKYLTAETVFALSGGLWFLLASMIPAIPMAMPIPAFIPGVEAITPGLLVFAAFVPVLLKVMIPGAVPFIHGVKPRENTEVKDA